MPPRKRAAKPAGPTPVEALTHDDKRVNIPTADSYDFVDEATAKIGTVLYPRDPSLDPQLVWKGKDEQDSDDLEVDAPPIYIQEKIDPRVLIENLRRTADCPEDEPELTLFESFDGLDEWQTVEFYQHAANWSNRLILGDSLQVMASLAERENLRGQVQMIYLDPPYGIKFGSNWQVSTRKRDVKDGKVEDATREVEQIKAFRDTWELGIHSYLSYLRDRLTVARDLLTESGSIFVQIGDENVHLVRSVLDEVFGSENYASLISVRKTSTPSLLLDDAFFYVLWYAKSIENVKYRQLFKRRDQHHWLRDTPGGSWGVEIDGERRAIEGREKSQPDLLPRGSRIYALSKLTSAGAASSPQPFTWRGEEYRPAANAHWKTTAEGLTRLEAADRLEARGGPPWFVRFHDDFPLLPINNLFDDTAGKSAESIYVVQTQPDVIQRCLLMTSDPGDLVLDPTCGSGTTAVVAEQWGRRWITTDTSRVAIALARQRLMGSRLPLYVLMDSPDGRAMEVEFSGHAAGGTEDTAGDVRKGFVYERVPHVTLKSIANNPDIKDGMSRAEIDEAIRRHADTELLYDRPYEDKKKVRVAGPFTVESLSPHRALSFESTRPESEEQAEREVSSASYEQTILDNLLKAGVQNGRTAERLKFDRLTAYAGKQIQAEGERAGGDDSTPQRVAISIGPQYGTVSPHWIKEAAREALRGRGFDLLLVCGFAFDARALETVEEFRPSDPSDFASVQAEQQLGKLPVLLVRMNADLAMGDALLKKTGSGNLFTVFGEPDVTIETTDDGLVVEIRGVDVYNPTTGEIRSNDTSEIAMWMIDSEYNEESFFVRHCYFTGGGVDPYARLKRALKADIDETAWASLYSTRSRTFPKPVTGKIAVKVINHYGDEVLKVYDV